MTIEDISRHDQFIKLNLKRWESKPLLRRVYRDFYKKIAPFTLPPLSGPTVEIGSGIGNIKEVLPACIRTELFPHPWIDQIENAYALSFPDQSVASIVLMDVFHHLRYPGNALQEFQRVLIPGGRLIIFDPCVSLLGRLVYGLCHHEPLALRDAITWNAPPDWNSTDKDYYAAQGNAFRIFFGRDSHLIPSSWRLITRERLSAISYVASGGYSKPQLYPEGIYPLMRKVDALADLAPSIFATRMLVVLEALPNPAE